MKPMKLAVSLIALLSATALGLSVLITPPPADAATPATEFSALLAAEDICAISKDAHTNNDAEAIAAVRQYLKATLESIGLETELRTYEKDYPKAEHGHGTHVTAVDVCGTLRGRSDRSILLVAHYDSNPGLGVGEAPGSHGASDDGYGVAVILETLRCLVARGALENTVRVVFTDAEETAMLGSSAIAGDAAFGAVRSEAVFNIESRGLEGPAILFETSAGNEPLIRFYSAHDKQPASWSLATDVYRVMPNYTDFTAFVDVGMPGLNFSNLYKIEDNHTPRDVYENISLSALQGYGEQVLPLVAAFASGAAPEGFRPAGDMSWFTLARGVLVAYPAWMNVLWLAAAVLLLGLYAALARRKGRLRWKTLWFAAALLVLALAAAAFGTLVSVLLALAFGKPWALMNLVGVPGFEWFTAFLAALVLAALVLVMRGRLRKGWTFEELTVSAALLNVLMAAVFTAALPGGAFLFHFGAVFTSALGMLSLRWKPFGLFTGFMQAWITAPVAALLLVALTPGALGVVLLFACFPLAIVSVGMADALGVTGYHSADKTVVR